MAFRVFVCEYCAKKITSDQDYVISRKSTKRSLSVRRISFALRSLRSESFEKTRGKRARFALRATYLSKDRLARGACRERVLGFERNHPERAGLRLKRLLIHGPAIIAVEVCCES
jgi:hypothetical protein